MAIHPLFLTLLDRRGWTTEPSEAGTYAFVRAADDRFPIQRLRVSWSRSEWFLCMPKTTSGNTICTLARVGSAKGIAGVFDALEAVYTPSSFAAGMAAYRRLAMMAAEFQLTHLICDRPKFVEPNLSTSDAFSVSSQFSHESSELCPDLRALLEPMVGFLFPHNLLAPSDARVLTLSAHRMSLYFPDTAHARLHSLQQVLSEADTYLRSLE